VKSNILGEELPKCKGATFGESLIGNLKSQRRPLGGGYRGVDRPNNHL